MPSPKRDRIQTLGVSSLTQQSRDPPETSPRLVRTSPTPTKREEFMSTLIKPQLSEPTLKKPITETWAYSSFAALLAPLAWLVLAADAAACGFYSAYAQY